MIVGHRARTATIREWSARLPVQSCFLTGSARADRSAAALRMKTGRPALDRPARLGCLIVSGLGCLASLDAPCVLFQHTPQWLGAGLRPKARSQRPKASYALRRRRIIVTPPASASATGNAPGVGTLSTVS